MKNVCLESPGNEEEVKSFFFCFILILTELYLLLLPRCETFSANFSLSAFVLTCVELERIAKNQMYVFKIIELLSLSSSS